MTIAHDEHSFPVIEQTLLDDFKAALKNREKVLPKKRPDFSMTVELLDGEQPIIWLVSKSGFVTQPKSSDIYRISFNTARLLQQQ